MLNISKSILFHSLRIIAFFSLIHMTILYWFPVQFPLSSNLAITLVFTSYMLKMYYLIPFALLICILMYLSSSSFMKNQIIMPAIMFVYFLCDSFILGYSFLDTWFNDSCFIAVQAIQWLISIAILVFMCIYFSYFRKKYPPGRQRRKTGDSLRESE